MAASKRIKSPSLQNQFDQLQISYRVREEENRVLRDRVSRIEGDNRTLEYGTEILKSDVNGYKAEVERKSRIILELQAQIGRLCIDKGIIR